MVYKKQHRQGTIRIQLVFLMCLIVAAGWSFSSMPLMSSLSVFSAGLILTLLVLISGMILVLHEFPESLGANDDSIQTKK